MKAKWAKNAAYRRRCREEGRCAHCGRPCYPYAECEERRAYRSANYHKHSDPPVRKPRGYKQGPLIVDYVSCRVCGETFGRPKDWAMMYRTDCPACRAAYKCDLRRRHKEGDPTLVGGRCCICGLPMHRRSKRAAHQKCEWTRTLDARAAAVRAQLEEWRNPTKDETWLRQASRDLSRARKLLAASASPSKASARAATSR